MRKAMSKKVVATVVLASIMGTTVVSAAEITKDESVFVNLQTNGALEKTTVSNWIHSDESNLVIKDKSDLDDIKNIKSDVEPSKDGENLTWKIDGSDLYYQGYTDKALPLDINIKYYLDGNEMKAEDIAGKSGKIKIELEVNNKVYKEADINGKTRKIYTPFTTAAIINLPIDKFKAVSVDSGMMLSEGNNNVITFVAFPGLDESLGLSDLGVDTKLSNKLTIEAEVEEFEMGPIMITATPNLPDTDKIAETDDVDKLNDKLNELKEANEKLNSKDMQEKLSLIKEDDKVNRANKLINDAFFAKNIETEKIMGEVDKLMVDGKKIATTANVLTGDYRETYMYMNLLYNNYKDVMTGVVSDDNFVKFRDDIKGISLDDNDKETIDKLSKLFSEIKTEQISAGTNLVKDGIALKNDFAPLQEGINNSILNTPGNNIQEKNVNFIKGIDGSLASASKLLSDETSGQIGNLANDMSGYASSYLTIKAQLAATYNMANSQGGQEAAINAFNAKKAELSQMITAVYGDNGAEVKAYIEGITLADISPEKIGTDAKKIGGYKEALPGLVNDMNSLKGMKPLIDGTHSILSQDGEAEKVAKLLGDLNDPATNQLLKLIEQGASNLNEDDLKSIEKILGIINTLSGDLEANKNNIVAIENLIKDLEGNQELKDHLNRLKGDLNNTESLIKEAKSLIGSATEPNKVNEVKSLSNKLMGMQQDLKDSEDILRITQDALRKDNVNQARSLLEALPEFQEKANSAQDVLAAKDEVVAASKEFDSFTGKSEDMDGSVKFIMKTKEVKMDTKKDEGKQETKKEKKGFFAWIKSLFTKEK